MTEDPAGTAAGAGQAQLWREADPDTFMDAIGVAAEQLGVQPLAAEKDYWVCEALRAIAGTHFDHIVFKGGTSLEKLRLVQRFSEDLDLLVVGDHGGRSATKTKLRTMAETARAAVGGELTDESSGGKPGSLHRSGYLHPPLRQQPAAESTLADPASVLLEFGQSGGPNPHSTRTVTSLLSRELTRSGFAVEPWADLRAFDVQVLHPGRTLLEKLLRINNFAESERARDDLHGWPRIGRQFYDVWALLGSDEVITFLRDTQTVAAVLTDCLDVSRQFTPDEPPPEAGFAACSAFAADGPLAARLRREHEAALRDLYYGPPPGPSFDDVLERVSSRAAELRIPHG